MQLGMIGLGRMGANMTNRLLSRGHAMVVYDRNPDAVKNAVGAGAHGATSLANLVQNLTPPRTVWMMVPAAGVESLVEELAHLLTPGDVLVDGGNSHYQDDIRRAQTLARIGVRYLDVGTSGGVWGAERGYCLMIGGDPSAARQLDSVFCALAPGVEAAPRTPEFSGDPVLFAEIGYLYCGPAGAGHFVKMVHNGIEYGLMAAYAEGFAILKQAGLGLSQQTQADAETTPLKNPEHYQYTFDLGKIAEVWRRGSVIASWLLDLQASAFAKSPHLEEFTGKVSDSGEGRWALNAAIDIAVPAPVLSAALFARFASRGASDFANRLLSAMRKEFGGHAEKNRSASSELLSAPSTKGTLP